MTQMAQIFLGSQKTRKAQKVITDDLKSPTALGRRTLATNGTQEIKEIKEILAAHDNLNDILQGDISFISFISAGHKILHL